MEQKRAAVLRRTAYCCASVLLLLFFLFARVNTYLAQSLKQGIYLFAAPVYIAGVLYFRDLRDGAESRLVAAYLAWVIVTRVLNGDRVLNQEYLFLLDLSLLLPLLCLGSALDDAGRRRVLNWLSVLLGVFFFPLGCIGVYAYVTGQVLVNPITGGNLTNFDFGAGFARLALLDCNVNLVSFQFMMPLLLMVYQFFAVRQKLWRIPVVLSALNSFVVIALTYSRSVMVSVSVCVALAALLCVCENLRAKGKGKGLTALFAILTLLIGCVGCYLLFGLTEKAFEAIGAPTPPVPVETVAETPLPALPNTTTEKTPLSTAQEAAPAEEAQRSFTGGRELASSLDQLSTNRTIIYRCALAVACSDPAMLLRGSAADGYMDRVNALLATYKIPPHVNVHNFLLQTLMLTGLPGLLLVLAFCALVFIRTLRFWFAEKSSASLGEKMLGLPFVACMLFGQLESGFFNFTDERTLYFYLLCGLLIGQYAAEARRAEA